jgi:hypothetical protein
MKSLLSTGSHYTKSGSHCLKLLDCEKGMNMYAGNLPEAITQSEPTSAETHAACPRLSKHLFHIKLHIRCYLFLKLSKRNWGHAVA